MAISVIGTPQTGVANNGGTVTLTWSTTPSVGDYTVVIVGSPAATPADVSVTTSGYTRLAYYTGAGSSNPSIGIFYKKQTGTPDTDVQVVADGAATTDSTAIGFVFRGVHGTTFSDQTPTTAGETESADPTPPAIVTQTDGAYVLVSYVLAGTFDEPSGAPSGYTGYSAGGNDTYDNSIASAYFEKATAGTETPGAWSGQNSGIWYAITIAIKPRVDPVLTCDTQTYSVSGVSLTALKADHKISGAVQTYAVTGVDLTALYKSIPFPLDTQTYSVTGVDLTALKADRRISAAVQTYIETGVDLTALKADRILVGAVQTYAVTGIDLIKLAVGKLLSADTQTYTVTGVDLTSLLAAHLITASVQTYAVTGVDLTKLAAQRVLAAAIQTYAVTGIDITLTLGVAVVKKIVAEVQAYTLTGIDLSFLHDWMMELAVRSYSVNGVSPSLLWDRILTLAVQTYALTGEDTNLWRNPLIRRILNADRLVYKELEIL